MPGSQYQVSSARIHHSAYSLSDSSDVGPEDEDASDRPRLSPLQKLTAAMCKDEGTIKELIIGRRVGFYKVRGEIGCGTFSRVKLAFHALTKGTTSSTPTEAGSSCWTFCDPVFQKSTKTHEFKSLLQHYICPQGCHTAQRINPPAYSVLFYDQLDQLRLTAGAILE